LRGYCRIGQKDNLQNVEVSANAKKLRLQFSCSPPAMAEAEVVIQWAQGAVADVAKTWDFVWGGSFVANGFLGLISSI